MNFTLTIRPSHYTARLNRYLVDDITRGKCFTCGCKGRTNYSGYTPILDRNADYVRVFNLVKHNRKSIRNSKGKTIKVIPGYWEAYVYDFSFDFLKVTGLSVRQNIRNFTLYKSK